MGRVDFGIWALIVGACLLGAADRAHAQPSSAKAARSSAQPAKRLDKVLPGDDWTFRPTVMVRRGTSQGTGTVIASVDGETLILTAAHVLRNRGSVVIELHRYNLGLEKQADDGRWPRVVPAEVIASDPNGDVAILRIHKMTALPFVARLFEDDPETLAADTVLTSLGIDLGARLSSWNTALVETTWFQLGKNDVDRPFLITAKIPEHGRSGGGLFTEHGRLVGLCVGHAEMVKGRRMGVFASVDSVQRLIREHKLTAVIDRSSARHAGPGQVAMEPPRHDRQTPSLTPTEARDPASLAP